MSGDESAGQVQHNPYKWLAIAAVASILGSGLVGGIVQYALITRFGGDPIVWTTTLGDVAAMLVFIIAFSYLGAKPFFEVIDDVR